MGPCCLSPHFSCTNHPLYIYDILVSIILSKILYLFVALQLTILFLLNLIPLVFLWRSSKPITWSSCAIAPDRYTPSSPRLTHQLLKPFSSTLARISAISCNKYDHSPLCHACQLDMHIHLPLHPSSSRASQKFDLIHCDMWTSPVPSISGYKYYLIILDDCSHFVWMFPLKFKSDTFSTLIIFLSLLSLPS